jgi:hypothetical protein
LDAVRMMLAVLLGARIALVRALHIFPVCRVVRAAQLGR